MLVEIVQALALLALLLRRRAALSPAKIIVRPEIGKMQDLAGKRLAISRIGSASASSAKLFVEKVGVKQESVSLIQLGGVSTRQAVLLAGRVQATILSDPQASAATRAG